MPMKNLQELDHDEFYQSALRALNLGLSYKDTCMEEQTSIMIAMTDSILALYLLLRDEIEEQKEAAKHTFQMMQKVR